MRRADYTAALRDFSTQVRRALEKEDYPVFTAWRSLYLTRQPAVEGWSTSLGEVNAPGLHHVVAYLDRTLPDVHPHFWVGFFPNGPTRANRLAEELRNLVGMPVQVTDSNVQKDGEGYQLLSSFSRRNYSRPILEIYRSGTKSFGRYVGACASRRVAGTSVKDAVAFLGKCFEGLECAVLALGRSNRDFYERISERVTVTTDVVPRSSALAKKTKIRDQYRCTVCELDPVLRYG